MARSVKLFVAIILMFWLAGSSVVYSQEPKTSQLVLPKADFQNDESAPYRGLLIKMILEHKDPEFIKKLTDFYLVLREIRIHHVAEKSEAEILELAIRGMVNGLDPYSNVFIGKEAGELARTLYSEDEYDGGIGIRFMIWHKNVVVTEVFEGSQSEKAGLAAGDVILRVDGQDIFGLSTDQITKMIKGKSGSSVVLDVRSRRRGKQLRLEIVRSKITVESIYYKNLRGNIAYVKVRSFVQDTPSRFRQAMGNSLGKKGLIIDLRGNPGGMLGAVIEMLGLMIGPDNMVIFEKTRDEEIELRTESRSDLPLNLPSRIVVLVNNYSASASEIMAGNLKHYGKATLIGTKTFGKASVQNYLNLETRDHSLGPETNLVLGITIGRYLLPDRTDISLSGVSPDIEVEQPCDFQPFENLTKRDAQFQRAIKFIKAR